LTASSRKSLFSIWFAVWLLFPVRYLLNNLFYFCGENAGHGGYMGSGYGMGGYGGMMGGYGYGQNNSN